MCARSEESCALCFVVAVAAVAVASITDATDADDPVRHYALSPRSRGSCRVRISIYFHASILSHRPRPPWRPQSTLCFIFFQRHAQTLFPTHVCFFLNRLTSQTNRRVVRLHCSHNYCVSRLPICSRVCAEAILLGPHFKVFFSLSVRVRGWVNPRVDHRLFVVSIGKSCGLKMMRFANSLFNENRRSIFDMCDKDDFFK